MSSDSPPWERGHNATSNWEEADAAAEERADAAAKEKEEEEEHIASLVTAAGPARGWINHHMETTHKHQDEQNVGQDRRLDSLETSAGNEASRTNAIVISTASLLNDQIIRVNNKCDQLYDMVEEKTDKLMVKVESLEEQVKALEEQVKAQDKKIDSLTDLVRKILDKLQ